MPNLLLAKNPPHPSELPPSLIQDFKLEVASINPIVSVYDLTGIQPSNAAIWSNAGTSANYQFFGQVNNVTYTTAATTYPLYNYPYTIATNVIYQVNGIYTTGAGSWIYEETAQQKSAREALEVKRKVAGKRAEELMLMMIAEEQRKQYKELGYFEVEINGKTYRIKTGTSGNVKLLDEKKQKEVASYCIHPAEYIPDQDTMLAQLLMLKTDEAKFLKTANKTVLY